MIHGSQDFIEAIYNDDARNYKVVARLWSTLADARAATGNPILTLLKANFKAGGIVIESTACSENEFPIGKCVMRKLTLTVLNASAYDSINFVRKWINIDFAAPNSSTYTRFGTYRVDNQDYDGANLVLECYDTLCFLDAPFTGVTAPINAYDLLLAIEPMVGWTDQNHLFQINQNIIPEFQAMTYSSVPSDEDLTCREIVEYVLQTMGYNIHTYGAARYYYLTQPNVNILSGVTPTDEYTAQQNGYHLFRYLFSLDISHTNVQVDGVDVVYNDPMAQTLVNSAGEHVTEYMNPLPGFVIRVENNPLINTYEEARACASNIFSKYGWMRYRKATFTHVEDPCIEAGDVGLVLDTDGTYQPVIVSHTRYQIQNRQSSYSGAMDTLRSASRSYSERTKAVSEAYNYSKVHSDANATLIATLQTDVGNVGTRVTALESEDFWYVQRCSYAYTCPASGSVNVTKNQLGVSIPTGFTIIGYTSISTANADVVPRSWNAQSTATGTSIVLRNLTSSQKTGTLTIDVLSMKTSRQQP